MIRPEARHRLIQERQAESAELLQQVFDEICRMHQEEFQGLMFTEILNLGRESETFVSSELRKNAERWFRRIGVGNISDRNLRRFFRIAAGQITKPEMDRYPILHELWDRICGVIPGAVPPEGFDPVRIPQRDQVAALTVHQSAARFQFASQASDPLSAESVFPANGSLVGTIRGRTGYLKIENVQEFAPASVPSDVFWQSGRQPQWATDWGSNEHGQWCEFTVKDVCQRMRWIRPGTFLMGSPETKEGRWVDEGPQDEVTISQGYRMFDTPVPQELWQSVMVKNPSHFKVRSDPSKL